MTAGILQGRGSGPGTMGGRFARIAMAVGIVSLGAGLATGHASTTLAAVVASWFLFAGIAAGSLAVAAAIHVTGGRWAAEARPAFEASPGFFLSAWLVLAGIVFTARVWTPAASGWGVAAIVLLAARQLLATAILFALGRAFISASAEKGGEPRRAGRLAVAYLVLYALTLSLWTIDLAMSASRADPSTVMPPLYFMGAFASGVAWIALLGGAGRISMGTRIRRDLGKMLFAFSGFWVYLLWAAFLPVWYGNLPEETAQVMARWAGAWKFVTAGAIALVFVIPFLFFFPEATRIGRRAIAFGSTVVLLGLTGMCFLLVVPPLHLRGGSLAVLTSCGVTIGMLGLFLLTVGARLGAKEP